MKRLCFLAVLMLLSSSAYAGNSFSFSIGGHRIRIEAPKHCRSTSCASVSIFGNAESRRKRDRYEDDDRNVVDPVKAPAPVQAAPPPVAIAAGNPPAPPAAVVPPPSVYRPAAVDTQQVAAPPLPPIPPAKIAPPLPPVPPPPVEKSAEAVRPAPVAPPQTSKVSHEIEDEPAGTPLGDWQTEGKGSVRIARCGNALCGYVLNSSSGDKGEAVLINMKAKADSKWSGNIYSHGSGDTYYGTMEMKAPNALRVEACALGRLYCSGNVWSRINAKPEKLITSRQTSPEPRS